MTEQAHSYLGHKRIEDNENNLYFTFIFGIPESLLSYSSESPYLPNTEGISNLTTKFGFL